MAMLRRLAVNADDFGFTSDVNRGIVEAHLNGILTSTTLMANGDAFDNAIRLADDHPTLDIGVHFVLVGGYSLLDPQRPFPPTVTALIRDLALRRIHPYAELKAQIQRVVDAGIRPTHLDTHKHTHLLPPVLDAVTRLAEEFGVRWVRRPFDLPLHGAPAEVPLLTRLVSRAFRGVRSQFHRQLSKHGCSTTDWFAGFQITGRFGADDVVHLLKNLPAGSTEFMVHPGFCTDELRNARTRLKESREAELRALVDPRVRQVLADQQITLTPYSQL